jgi:hypothetical protein
MVARAAFCNGPVSASSVCGKSELHGFTIINWGGMVHFGHVDGGNQTDGPPGNGTTHTDGAVYRNRSWTMNSMKTLTFAGVAGLCLALGACTPPPVTGSVQSGSSDVETLTPHGSYNVTTHPQFDFSGSDGGSGNE